MDFSKPFLFGGKPINDKVHPSSIGSVKVKIPDTFELPLEFNIKVAEYLFNSVNYSFTDYLVLPAPFRKQLNEATLNYLTEKKSNY